MSDMKVHFMKETVEWETPQELFDELQDEFGLFDLDVCATHENTKALTYFTKEGEFLNASPSEPVRFNKDDGLTGRWGQRLCWMNPPYGREMPKWIAKAYEESRKGATVVCLLPARTDTMAFHTYIWNRRLHKPWPNVEVRFLKGRLKFGKARASAPFPSMIVIFWPSNQEPIESA